jgi:hypothetical protein
MHGQGQTFDDTDAVGDLQGLKPQALHGGNPLAPHTVDAFAKAALSRLAAKKLLLAVSSQHAVTAASAPTHVAAAQPALVLPHAAAAAAAHASKPKPQASATSTAKPSLPAPKARKTS